MFGGRERLGGGIVEQQRNGEEFTSVNKMKSPKQIRTQVIIGSLYVK